MDIHKLKAIVEALIFVAEEPLSVGAITLLLEQEGVGKSDIEKAIHMIEEEHNNNTSSGIQLVEVAGGYHFRTKPVMAEWIQRLNVPKPVRLSQPSMETLAIIAYRQPIVRAEIEEIRGVDTGGVLKTLLERGLIKIIGKRDEPGNPLIYGTTKQFLEMFNLKSLDDLPPLKSYEELEQIKKPPTAVETDFMGGNSKGFIDDLVKEEAKVFDRREAWDKEDKEVLNDIESGIKRIRRLEREIFPKPEAILSPVEKGGGNAASSEDAGGGSKDSPAKVPGIDD